MKFLLWEIRFEPYGLARLQWILFKLFGYKPKNPCGHTKYSRGCYCHLPMDKKHCIVINDKNIHKVVCKCCGDLRMSSSDYIEPNSIEKLWF